MSDTIAIKQETLNFAEFTVNFENDNYSLCELLETKLSMLSAYDTMHMINELIRYHESTLHLSETRISNVVLLSLAYSNARDYDNISTIEINHSTQA